MEWNNIGNKPKIRMNKLLLSPKYLTKTNIIKASILTIFLLKIIPDYAQTSSNTQTNKEKATVTASKTSTSSVNKTYQVRPAKTTITMIDTTSHEAVINANVDTLIAQYWAEKWMDLVRKHMLIEINNLRRSNWSKILQENIYLNKSVQDYAKYMNDRGYFDHTNQEWLESWDRIKNAGGDFAYTWENIAKWHKTIIEVFLDWTNNSVSHKNTILNNNYEYLWVWYNWTYRVLNFGGN